MPDRLPFPRHAVSQTLLRLSLICGAGVDAVLALLLLLTPEPLVGALGLALPGEPLYLWLLALCLALLSAVYLLPAYDVVAYSGNIAVAILGRLAGGGLLLVVTLERPGSLALLWLGLAELGLGLIHALLWVPGRRTPFM